MVRYVIIVAIHYNRNPFNCMSLVTGLFRLFVIQYFGFPFLMVISMNLRPLSHATDVRKVMLPRGFEPLLASPDGEQRGGWGGPSPPSLLVASGGQARVEDSRTGCARGVS
jgi:hypothetical protein